MATKLKNLVLNEISLVDRPANPGAKVSLFKRDNSEQVNLSDSEKSLLEKFVSLFNKVNTANDQTEGVDKMADKENQNTDTVTKADLEAVTKSLKEVQDELAFNKALNTLSNDERDFAKGLVDKAKKEFVMEPDEAKRKKTMEDAKKADADKAGDVLKGLDPEVRKFFEDQLTAVNKRVDEAEKIAKDEREKRENMEFEKRAEHEFSNLSGDAVSKAKALKAISTIADKDAREYLESTLKTANTTVGKFFEELGGGHEPAAGSAADLLDKRAADLAKAKNITVAKAYDEYVSTHEGAELYKQLSVEKRATN